MSTPSLLNIPYLYKAGTLYSQIPESGAGDFSVTRATTPTAGRSTRINKDGLIELVADNVPRLDYPLGGAVNGCPALLVEPSATNSCFQSQGFNNSPWVAASVSATSTTLTNSPDGTQNAFDVTISNAGLSNLRQFIACANNTTYTVSCFYKNKALTAGQTFEMRYTNENPVPNNLNAIATIDLATGTATFAVFGTAGTGFSGTATGRVENYGNGWYRVSMTFTVGSAGANASGIFRPIVGVNVTRNFFAWGAQMEVGSVATSYIPTTTQAIARGEDRITRTGITSLIGQTEGTFYFEGEAEFAGTDLPMINRSIQNSIVITKNTANRLVGYVYYNTNVFIAWTTPAPVIGPFKAAVAYRQGSPGDSAFFVNGVQVSTTNTTNWTFTGALNDIVVRSEGWAGGPKPYRVRTLGVYPNRIPNTAAPGVLSLATLTAP